MNGTQIITHTPPGLITGLMLILLMIMFVALCVWAWSSRQKKTFEHASLLPLEELHEETPANDTPCQTHSCGCDQQTANEGTQNAASQAVVLKHLSSAHD